MSNTQRLRPPQRIRRYARRLRCSDCHSNTGKPWCDGHGVWHVSLLHDPDCPVINGTVPPHNIHKEALT